MSDEITVTERLWVSVDEHLPEDGERVLIWHGTRVEIATRFTGFWHTGDGHYFNSTRVTHWMELPESPAHQAGERTETGSE